MATLTTVIDIASIPELRRIVEEARLNHATIELRDGGEPLATIAPVAAPKTARPEMVGVLTRAQYQRAMSAAGGWAGIVEIDELKRDLAESRGSHRPPVDLDLPDK